MEEAYLAREIEIKSVDGKGNKKRKNDVWKRKWERPT